MMLYVYDDDAIGFERLQVYLGTYRAYGKKLVQCRDCKYYSEEFSEWDKRPWCEYFNDFVNPNGFCSWGEFSEA